MHDKPLTDFIKSNNIRALWDEASHKWWFSAIDLCAALRGCDYKAARNYYHAWMHKQHAANGQLLTVSKQLKFKAADGKRYYTAAVDIESALRMIQTIPSAKANELRMQFVEPLLRDEVVAANFAQLGTANRDDPQTEMYLQTITRQPIE